MTDVVRDGNWLEARERAQVGPVLQSNFFELVAQPVGEGGEGSLLFECEDFERGREGEEVRECREAGENEGGGEREGSELFRPAE